MPLISAFDTAPLNGKIVLVRWDREAKVFVHAETGTRWTRDELRAAHAAHVKR